MIKTVYLSYSSCPESSWHIIRAIALGQPSVLTLCKDKKRINYCKERYTKSTSEMLILTNCFQI